MVLPRRSKLGAVMLVMLRPYAGAGPRESQQAKGGHSHSTAWRRASPTARDIGPVHCSAGWLRPLPQTPDLLSHIGTRTSRSRLMPNIHGAVSLVLIPWFMSALSVILGWRPPPGSARTARHR